MTCRTIIFDLDGTLVHSAPDLHASVNEALAAMDRPTLPFETVLGFIGNGVEKLVERSLAATGGGSAALTAEAVALFLNHYNANMTTLTRPYPGVGDCLEKLRAAGIRLGICTNKPTEPARRICEDLGIAHHFEVILGAASGQPQKPDPTPLLTCVEMLNAHSDEVIFVGDSTVDQQTARNAGIKFYLFLGGYLNGSTKDLSDEFSFSDWNQVDFIA